MISHNQEKIIMSLHTKKGREKHKLCLIEGDKFIQDNQDKMQLIVSRSDFPKFNNLVTTKTPQEYLAIAPIPEWTIKDIFQKDIVLLLDHVQDPGNIGTILRLASAFNSSLILLESADITSPKVLRSSVGSFFKTPWIKLKNSSLKDIQPYLNHRNIYRLEKKKASQDISQVDIKKPLFLIVGSEGQGISVSLSGLSIYIPHTTEVESLNVASALAITLYLFNQK